MPYDFLYDLQEHDGESVVGEWFEGFETNEAGKERAVSTDASKRVAELLAQLNEIAE